MYRQEQHLVGYTGRRKRRQHRQFSEGPDPDEATDPRGARRRDSQLALGRHGRPGSCCAYGPARCSRQARTPHDSRACARRRWRRMPRWRPGLAVVEQNAMVKQYCVGCHSDRGKAGGLTLASFDAAKATDHVVLTEKMIRKLRAQMMPPAGARRPEADQILALASALETRIDRAAALNPNPGSRPFQRLNRAEYARAVKDMLGIDIDVASLLPADTISNGFDNVADAQAFSPTLMESYLRAAARVTALAIGDPEARGDRNQLPRAQDRVAAGARRWRAVRHARRAVGAAHVPGRRRLRLQGRTAQQRLRRAVRRPQRRRDGGNIGRRRAQGDHEDRPAHGRDHDRPVAEDAAHGHQGRRAPRDGGVPPALRRARSTTWSRRSITRSPTPRSASPSASPPSLTSRTSASSGPTT